MNSVLPPIFNRTNNRPAAAFKITVDYDRQKIFRCGRRFAPHNAPKKGLLFEPAIRGCRPKAELDPGGFVLEEMGMPVSEKVIMKTRSRLPIIDLNTGEGSKSSEPALLASTSRSGSDRAGRRQQVAVALRERAYKCNVTIDEPIRRLGGARPEA